MNVINFFFAAVCGESSSALCFLLVSLNEVQACARSAFGVFFFFCNDVTDSVELVGEAAGVISASSPSASSSSAPFSVLSPKFVDVSHFCKCGLRNCIYFSYLHYLFIFCGLSTGRFAST
jgi:hypothetical protein